MVSIGRGRRWRSMRLLGSLLKEGGGRDKTRMRGNEWKCVDGKRIRFLGRPWVALKVQW
jgi:hypothetical protein